MKLVFCPKCTDTFRVWINETKHCHCGASWGYYLDDDLTAVIGGKAIPLAIPNDELRDAITNRPQKSAQGRNFTACVIPEECSTVIHKGNDRAEP